MTIYHKHHIIPRHAGGSDDPSNLIELTIEEHAEAHKKLWEEHGRWQDHIAWKGLSGQIDKDEIRRLRVKEYNSEQLQNRTHHLLSGEIQRKSAMERISKGMHNDVDLKTQASCPHCGRIGQKFVMRRWHFDNCRYQS
jgi:hypothetical protein